MDAYGVLRQFKLFLDAGPDTRREMSAAGRTTNLPSGATYIHEGVHADVVALVGAGYIRVFKTSETGREITLYGVGPGEFCMLNVLCVLTGTPSPASARVEEPVEAVAFRGDDFRRWIGTDHAVRSAVFALMAKCVSETMALVEEIAFKKMDVRLAQFLRTRLPAAGPGRVALATTHEMIASELGSAREVISRLLKEFERQGAIELGRGRITLADGGVLAGLAGDS